MSEQKRVPELRFPEFDGKLESKTLGDFMSFKNGINADKGQYGHGRKFINVLDIIANKPIYHDKIIGSVSVSDKEFEKNEVKYGDILFQRSSETREEAGQSNIYLDKHNTATFGGFVIRGRPTVKFSPQYFDALLKTSTLRKEITTKSGGSTRFNVGQDSLSAVNVTLTTDFEEQQKIANFLSSVDTKLAKLGRKKALLEDYKRGLMQQIFSLKLRFKQDDGSEFPEWGEDLLFNIAEVTMGASPSSKSYNTKGLGLPLLQGNADIKNRRSSPRNYTTEITKECYPQDILFSVRAPVGEVAISFHHACIGRGIASIRSLGKIKMEYLWHFLIWQEAKWKAVAQGSTFESVNSNDIKQLKLKVPNPTEQQKIADFLSLVDQKVDAVVKQIDQLETFKKGLLQKLFV